MKAAAIFIFATSISLSSSAFAAPARTLVIARSQTNPIAVLNFSSLEDCDAMADHISQIRTPNASNIGLPGAWKSNFKYGGQYRQEPRIAMLCIPSTEDLPAVVKGLEEKELYRNLYGDKKD